MKVICQNYESCAHPNCGHALLHKKMRYECANTCNNQDETTCKEATKEIISKFVLMELQ